MKSILTIVAILSLTLLGACASVPKFQEPSGSMGLEERQALYQRSEATYSFWEGLRFGGVEPSDPVKVLLASGDPETIALARKYRRTSWVGIAIGILGTVTGSVAARDRHPGASAGDSVDAQFVGSMAAVAALQTTVTKWGKQQYLAPAAQAYNRYLRRELGLP